MLLCEALELGFSSVVNFVYGALGFFPDRISKAKRVALFSIPRIISVKIFRTSATMRCDLDISNTVAFDTYNALRHYKYSSSSIILISFRTLLTSSSSWIFFFLHCNLFIMTSPHTSLSVSAPRTDSKSRESSHLLAMPPLLNLVLFFPPAATID